MEELTSKEIKEKQEREEHYYKVAKYGFVLFLLIGLFVEGVSIYNGEGFTGAIIICLMFGVMLFQPM